MKQKTLFTIADILEPLAATLRCWHSAITAILLICLMCMGNFHTVIEPFYFSCAIILPLVIYSGAYITFCNVLKDHPFPFPTILGGWLAGSALGAILLFFFVVPIWPFQPALALLCFPAYFLTAELCISISAACRRKGARREQDV